LHPESKRVRLLLLLMLWLLELRTERRLLLLLLPAPRAEPKRVRLRLLLLLRGRVHEPALRSVLAAAPSRTSIKITTRYPHPSKRGIQSEHRD
jgi:hypothetical protein